MRHVILFGPSTPMAQIRGAGSWLVVQRSLPTVKIEKIETK